MKCIFAPADGFPSIRPEAVYFVSLNARLPTCGVAPTVHAGHDNNGFIVDAIENYVWEPFEKRPPDISVNHLAGSWMGGDVAYLGIDGREKFFSEPGPPPFIPLIRFLDVCRSSGADE